MNHATQQMMETLKKGKSLFDLAVGELSSSFFIGDKSLSEWHAHFKIELPESDVGPEICKQIDVKIIKLHQEASFLHSKAVAYEAMSLTAAKAAYKQTYREIVESYKSKNSKLPGAEAISRAAEADETVADLTTAADIATVHKDFFRNILNHLDKCIKVIENISINNAVQAKVDAHR